MHRQALIRLIFLICWVEALDAQIEKLSEYRDEMLSESTRRLLMQEINNVRRDQERTNRLITRLRERMSEAFMNQPFFE